MDEEWQNYGLKHPVQWLHSALLPVPNNYQNTEALTSWNKISTRTQNLTFTPWKAWNFNHIHRNVSLSDPRGCRNSDCLLPESQLYLQSKSFWSLNKQVHKESIAKTKASPVLNVLRKFKSAPKKKTCYVHRSGATAATVQLRQVWLGFMQDLPSRQLFSEVILKWDQLENLHIFN